MSRLSILCFAGIALALLAGCKVTKLATIEPPKEVDLGFLINHLDSTYVLPNWFSCRAKISYESAYEKIQFTSYIRIKKDSVIWFNVKKWGIEIARGLILPDSVCLLDRFHNNYIKEEVDYLSKKYHLPLDFDGFQKLVLGHPDTLHNEMLLKSDSAYHTLQTENVFSNLILYVNNRNFLLSKSYWLDLLHAQSLIAEFGESDFIDGHLVSNRRKIEASGEGFDDFKLDITFANVEVNAPKKISFSIPTHYVQIRP